MRIPPALIFQARVPQHLPAYPRAVVPRSAVWNPDPRFVAAESRRYQTRRARDGMKSHHANSGAGIAGLILREHDQPKPGSHEARIQMRANSLSFRQ
jgi:hypothetical protein